MPSLCATVAALCTGTCTIVPAPLRHCACSRPGCRAAGCATRTLTTGLQLRTAHSPANCSLSRARGTGSASGPHSGTPGGTQGQGLGAGQHCPRGVGCWLPGSTCTARLCCASGRRAASLHSSQRYLCIYACAGHHHQHVGGLLLILGGCQGQMTMGDPLCLRFQGLLESEAAGSAGRTRHCWVALTQATDWWPQRNHDG
jgi:hypothetical protein